MPELPEVETVCRTLENQIKGKKINSVEVYYDRIVCHPTVEEFKEKLKGQTFLEFSRRGKHLIFTLDAYILIVHLRMEGKFYVKNEDEPISKHTHLNFIFNDHISLRFNDVRKFATMHLYHKDEKLDVLEKLGKEPFDETLSYLDLYEMCKNRKTTIKQILLDQSYIAGIGNIYADEICFACGIHPAQKVNTITKKMWIEIIKQTRLILQEAILAGGTTIRSYTSSLGITGLFQLSVKVHTRANQPCVNCGTIIKKTKVATRGTYYCPCCQTEKL